LCTLTFRWTFREFNELPHAFERRLGPSYSAAEDYLKLFTKSAAIASLGRALVFISGSLGAVLLAFAAVNDSILLHVKLGQWNLLWYVGILGITFSVGKGMLPDTEVHPPYIRNLFAEMDSALAKIATHTHFFPDFWKGRGWDNVTQQAISGMFQYKAKLFLTELVAVMFAPLILGISLPKCAEDICAFVQQIKMEVPGSGDICGYSAFDFDTFEDDSWEGRTMGVRTAQSSVCHDGLQPPMTTESVSEPMNSQMPKTQNGKMEKSFFSFKSVHPSWKCSASGQYLVDRVETYQHQQAVALARERDYHIEAAARQLETLRILEQRQKEEDISASSAPDNNIDESYIGREAHISEADAGAHSGGESLFSRTRQDSLFEAGIHSDAVPPTRHPTSNTQAATSGSLPPRQRPGNPPPPDAALLLERNSIRRSPSPADIAVATSILHYGDTALSAELLRVLNRSTLDPNQSVAGSVLGTAFDHSLLSISNLNSTYQARDQGEDEVLDRNAQRQYMWLERYHSHLATQHEESEHSQLRNTQQGASTTSSSSMLGDRRSLV